MSAAKSDHSVKPPYGADSNGELLLNPYDVPRSENAATWTVSETRCPISSIPNELLHLIIRDACATTQQCIQITHVCARWRNAALSIKSLWQDIDIPPEYNLCSEAVTELAKRSCNLTLNLEFIWEPEISPGEIEIDYSYAARIATIYLDVSTANAYPFKFMHSLELNKSLIALESFEIIQGDVLRIGLNDGLASIKNLTVTGGIQASHTITLPRLVSASFNESCIEEVKAVMLATMMASPDLETLYLSRLLPIVIEPRNFPPQIMARLTTLLVESTYLGLLIDLCLNHEMPRLRELIVACLGDEKDDDESTTYFSLPRALRTFVSSSESIVHFRLRR